MFVYEIKKDDIRKRRIVLKCNGCNNMKDDIDIFNFMGYILPCDIGKRIYKNKNIYQVENQEQLTKRINKK